MARGRKTGGRARGTLNKSTAAIKDAARAFVEDTAGQAKLLAQYQAGELNPSVLAMFYHYAYGKPKDTIAFEQSVPVMVVDELMPEDIEQLRVDRSE